MPLPSIPDGPEKPPTLAGEPGAPAAASPQAALLAELWAAAHEAADGYESANGADARNYAGGAADATQEAVTSTLVHLYGVTRNEAQWRVQRALAAGNDDAQVLL